MTQLQIRSATDTDISILENITAAMGGQKEAGYFERSLALQDMGERVVMIGEYDGQAVAYGMLSWAPKYKFYKIMGYPEIQDLNVIPDYRRKGIARAMIAHFEMLAADKGMSHMGISVGLTPEYGPAQRLYVGLGYIPDGHGVTYDRKSVSHGDRHPVDDDLCLMMLKNLQSS